MSKQFKNPWTKILKDYTDMRRTLADDASRLALNEFRENFNRQGYLNAGGVLIPWKKTGSGKASAIFGGRNSYRRIGGKDIKTNGRILMGRPPVLRSSLRKKPDFNTARVVTDVIYAKIHNEGGVIRRTYTSHKKKNGKIITNTHSVDIKMPKRTFMNEAYVNKMIEADFVKRLKRIFR